jgi:hypothetical protein
MIQRCDDWRQRVVVRTNARMGKQECFYVHPRSSRTHGDLLANRTRDCRGVPE